MAVVPHHESSAFSQQGSFDWVSLARAPLEISFNVLTRYSKAGVDPCTVVAGQAACSALVMPHQPKKEVLKQLSKLSKVKLYNGTVQVGFGLKHVLQDLVARDEGISCLAICGCLTQSYDNFYCAQVLRALCQQQKMPSDLVPGVLQWEALLKACAKIFSTSKFSRLLEGFVRIVTPWTMIGIDERESTPPDRLAASLLLLARLSRKHLENLSISGGIDCAWLAAVAMFVFDLTVDIWMDDGDCRYRSDHGQRSSDGGAQLNVFVATEASTGMDVTRQCFSIPSGRSLLSGSGSERQSRFEIRSQWSTILLDSYGTAAAQLLQGSHKRRFGQLLVYLANRTDTHQDSPAEIPGEHFTFWPRMRQCPQSLIGIDLLDFAIKQLPELQPCLDAVDFRNISVSEEQAVEHLKSIRESCWCRLRRQRRHPVRYCVDQLALEIAPIIRKLSRANIQDLLPSVSAFRSLHTSRLSIGKGGSPKLHGNPLQDVSSLFSSGGGQFRRTVDLPLAVAQNGICYFFGSLMDIKLGSELAATVFVMPGHLECDGAIFETVEETRPSGVNGEYNTSDFGPVHEKLRAEVSLDTEQWSAFSLCPDYKFDLLVSDRRSDAALTVIYRVQHPTTGLPRIVSLRQILDWALQTDPRLLLPCQCDNVTTTYRIQELCSTGELKKTLWDFHTTEMEAGVSEQDNLGQLPGYLSCKYSLMFILSAQDWTSVEIHKNSNADCNNPEFRLEQLYAEFARRFAPLPDGRRVQADIVQLGDCAGCIMTYVSTQRPRLLRSPVDAIAGQVILHTGGKISRTTKFELRRLPEVETTTSWWPFPALGGPRNWRRQWQSHWQRQEQAQE